MTAGSPTEESGQSARAELAVRWASVLSATAYAPVSRADLVMLLRGLLAELVDALRADQFCADAARAIGRRLVVAQFTGEESLSRSIEVLGLRLPALPELRDVDGLAARMVSLLGAVAAGYTGALRMRTLDQQETVKAALLRACQNAEREQRSSEAKFRELFTSSAVGIAISDLDGTLIETNEALSEIVGRPASDLVGGSLFELFHPDDAGRLGPDYQRLTAGRTTRFRLQWQVRLLDEDGEAAWTYLAVSLLHDSGGRPARHVTMVQDVTELHLLGERLNHQSLHDSLTGLPNQQFFISTLEGVVGRDNQASAITLCKIDLDGFAVVNDGLGREVGDQLLRSVAARLRSLVADEKATVARFGADEFAVLIENSPTTPDVATLSASINAELAEPVYIDGNGLAVSACVGVVEHRGGGLQPAELLRAAEATLRRIKTSGARQWGLFDPHRDAEERARDRLAAVMPAAWENGDIGIEYQPLARLTDGAVVAVEALLRWDHPQLGPIVHSRCLALAADTGLMLPLGEWLLRRACERLESSRQATDDAPALHVGLTTQQSCDPDLVSCVRHPLDETGFPAEHLQLGIPVQALGTGQGDAEDNVRVLAGMGVGIGLVEYGGAADLLHLEDLPVRAVRIARRLVGRVAFRPHGHSVVARALTELVPLVHSCGAAVIVGNLETEEQVDWWRSAGADVGQGKCFAPPAPSVVISSLPTDRRG